MVMMYDPSHMEAAVSKLMRRGGDPARLRVHPSLWRALATAMPRSVQLPAISADGAVFGLPVVVDAELPAGGWRLEYDGIARLIEVEAGQPLIYERDGLDA